MHDVYLGRLAALEQIWQVWAQVGALDHPPVVPTPALRDTVQLLAELAPAVELIEAATGRSTHSPLPVLR
ncbi:MAG: hypothetical protein ACRDRP_16145 [Pseudonocardiaceae bacterium]